VTFCYYYLLLSIAELMPSSPLAKASYTGVETVIGPAAKNPCLTYVPETAGLIETADILAVHDGLSLVAIGKRVNKKGAGAVYSAASRHQNCINSVYDAVCTFDVCLHYLGIIYHDPAIGKSDSDILSLHRLDSHIIC